jgi:hypothetical protein
MQGGENNGGFETQGITPADCATASLDRQAAGML